MYQYKPSMYAAHTWHCPIAVHSLSSCVATSDMAFIPAASSVPDAHSAAPTHPTAPFTSSTSPPRICAPASIVGVGIYSRSVRLDVHTYTRMHHCLPILAHTKPCYLT